MSERHKAYWTVKPQEWGKDDKKLKGSGKKGPQSFDNHVYILKGTEGPGKFSTWEIDIRSTVVNGKEIIKRSKTIKSSEGTIYWREQPTIRWRVCNGEKS